MSDSRTYIAIDLKSFYASVECVERGLDPLTARLVVADESRTEKTICLAVSPALKAYGVSGRPRLFEVEQKVREINRLNPGLNLDYIVAKPRMAKYVEYSRKIFSLYLQFVSSDDVYVYSIDEVFIDVTNYLKTYKMTAHELAIKMIRQVLKETGITATAGIGTNLYLAKVAMDIVAKHIPADADGVRIAELDEMSYRKQLWDHQPMTDFWRFGKGTVKRLRELGISTMGELARFSLQFEQYLFHTFGVNAELLIDHAWGYEPCTIEAIKNYKPLSKSLGGSQVFSMPYTPKKALVVLTEMSDNLALELVQKNAMASGITIELNYDSENLTNPQTRAKYHGEITTDYYGRQVPKHGHGTERFAEHTSSSRLIVVATKTLFNRIVNADLLIRRVSISLMNVISEEAAKKIKNQPKQLDMFADESNVGNATAKNEELQRERRLQETILNIKNRFGKNAILKGVSFEEGATAKERNQQIGGHHE